MPKETEEPIIKRRLKKTGIEENKETKKKKNSTEQKWEM